MPSDDERLAAIVALQAELFGMPDWQTATFEESQALLHT
jgi:hypothetical protein